MSPELTAFVVALTELIREAISLLRSTPPAPPVRTVSHADRQARYRDRLRVTRDASDASRDVTRDGVAISSSLSSSSLFPETYKKEIGEESSRGEEIVTGVTSRDASSVTLKVVPKRERRERPPEFANDAERDAWCQARGLPVGHPSLERFLAEQRNCRQGKIDWRAAWRVNESRITSQLQDEAAKKSRLNGNAPIERAPVKVLTPEQVEARLASAQQILGRRQ